jgi:hypothetical protein
MVWVFRREPANDGPVMDGDKRQKKPLKTCDLKKYQNIHQTCDTWMGS